MAAERLVSSYAGITQAVVGSASRTLADFIAGCELHDQSQQDLLEYVLAFARDIEEGRYDPTQLLSTYPAGPGAAFKRVSLYYHTDRYANRYPSPLAEEHQQLLATAFCKFRDARAHLIAEESRMDEAKACAEMREFVVDQHEIEESVEQRIEELSRMELKCFHMVMAYHAVLPEQTAQSLLRLYGSIVSYLVNWAAEHNLEWLVSEGNLRDLGQRLKTLGPYIDQHHLRKEFDRALAVASCPTSADAGTLAVLMGHRVDFVDQQKWKDGIGVKADGFGIGAGVIGVAVTIALSSNPVGWGLAIASALACAGQAYFSHKRRELRDQDRLNYYAALFETISGHYKLVYQHVISELDYRNTVKLTCERVLVLHQDVKEIQWRRLSMREARSGIPRALLGPGEMQPWRDAVMQERSLSKEEMMGLAKLGFDEKDCLAGNLSRMRMCLKHNLTKKQASKLPKTFRGTAITSGHVFLPPPRAEPLLLEVVDERKEQEQAQVNIWHGNIPPEIRL